VKHGTDISLWPKVEEGYKRRKRRKTEEKKKRKERNLLLLHTTITPPHPSPALGSILAIIIIGPLFTPPTIIVARQPVHAKDRSSKK
jgi:hypothetical protein